MAGWIWPARCIFLPGLTGRFDLVLRGKLSANCANELGKVVGKETPYEIKMT